MLEPNSRVPTFPPRIVGGKDPKEAQEIDSTILQWGSHALTHPSLPSLSPTEKKREIEESRARCGDIFGQPPQTFAYPYGDRDSESEAVVADSGYLSAFTTRFNTVDSQDSAFALPRMQAGNWRAATLARALHTV